MEEAEETDKHTNEARGGHRAVPARGSTLCFVIADLALVDGMYQYSLAYFAMMFSSGIFCSFFLYFILWGAAAHGARARRFCPLRVVAHGAPEGPPAAFNSPGAAPLAPLKPRAGEVLARPRERQLRLPVPPPCFPASIAAALKSILGAARALGIA